MKRNIQSDLYFSKPPYVLNEKLFTSHPATTNLLFEEAAEFTDGFCRMHLNEEYAQVNRRVIAALCRKRPSPLLGNVRTNYVAGILYLITSTNYLFDKSQTPHMTAEQLRGLLHVSKSTAHLKSKQVLVDLGWSKNDFRLSLPSNLADSPLTWMVTVDKLLYDARRLPLPLRMNAYEHKVIPFIPFTFADQDALLQDASIAIEMGELELADNLLDHCMNHFSDHTITYYLLSLLSLDHEQPKESDDYTKLAYESLLKKFPKWQSSLNADDIKERTYLKIIYDRAVMHYEQGELDDAIEVFGILLKLNAGDNFGARFLLAGAYAALPHAQLDELLDNAEESGDWRQPDSMLETQNQAHHFWPVIASDSTS